MLKRLLQLLALSLAASAPRSRWRRKLRSCVYTALETDQLKAYTESLRQDRPEHRAEVRARLHRRHHRQAARREGEPAGRRDPGRAPPPRWRSSRPRACWCPTRRRASRSSTPRFSDTGKPPTWVGMDVCAAVVCYNTVEGAEDADLPKPETWKDLTKPVYKGQITMPNPASSGTGYLDVTAWLQLDGRGGAAGSTWTSCTRTSRSTRTPAPSPAASRARASSWSASPSTSAATT